MLASLGFYTGVVVALAGAVMVVRPVPRLGVRTRRRAVLIGMGGAAAAVGSLLLPAFESRAVAAQTHQDRLTPVWQFREVHSRRIAARPAAVYAAIRRVRADDILLFRTLTWIRRGGRPLPEGILNAGPERPIIDVALNGGFALLADEPPRELVLGAIVDAPASTPRTRALLLNPPDGYSVATMNFVLTPDGDGTIVTTETRVFSNGLAARRRFARYWRVIYPGSSLIRHMWLRAIERRVVN